MKKYKQYGKKLTALACAVLMLFALTIPASAAAGTKTYVIDSSSQHSVIAKMTTSYVASKIYPITASQALHTKGIATTIGVATSVTTTCTASDSLTVQYSDAFISLSRQLGVSYSQSCTVSTSVSYSIPATTASGRYRIETVYPALRVQEVVTRTTSAGTETLLNKTITYAPETNSQYYRLNRYANP